MLILLLLIFVAAAGGALIMYYASKLNVQEIDGESGTVFSSAPKNILLIGVDNDYAAGMDQLGNADGIMLLTINDKSDSVVLTSFMRDIKVSVPGHGKMKLTSSYHTGGTPLLIATMEENFGIDIDAYVLVNYLNVIDIVDAAGGVTLEVNRDELYYMQTKIENLNKLLGIPAGSNIIPVDRAGMLKLNGVQTAAFMRVRMAGNNDLERTERARRVIMGLKDNVLSMSLGEMNDFAERVLPCITTDMGHTELLSLVLKAPACLRYEILSERIPVDGSFSYSDDGNAYVLIDFAANIQHLQVISGE